MDPAGPAAVRKWVFQCSVPSVLGEAQDIRHWRVSVSCSGAPGLFLDDLCDD